MEKYFRYKTIQNIKPFYNYHSSLTTSFTERSYKNLIFKSESQSQFYIFQIMKNWQILALTAITLTSIAMLLQQQNNSGDSAFELWKAQFGFHFESKQDSYRQMIFQKNLDNINKHNSNPHATYTMGVNQFTHLSQEQFAQMFLSSIYLRQNRALPQRDVEVINNKNVQIGEIDWQALGKVSKVKDQGQCDAGYAFCSSSLIESFYLIQNRPIQLSEQQIVDCSASYTTFGCQSGSRNGTLTYIRDKGLVASAEYPYKGVKGNCQKQTGQFKPAYTHVEFNGCQNIQNGLYGSPLTVAVNAKDWQSYRAGIYNGCTSTEVNHDILLIGLSATAWRLKNSWGQKWGEYGYIRLAPGNTCGICEKPGFGFKK